jgi:hypothetical protein
MHQQAQEKWTDVHQQTKNKRDICAPASTGEKEEICTSKHSRRGTDMHQLDKEEKDGYAPAAKEERDRNEPASFE